VFDRVMAAALSRARVRENAHTATRRTMQGMQGQITKTEAGPVTVHTYTAPEEGWRANSHLIELPEEVVMFDAPLVRSLAEEVREALAGVGKPLSRIYVSHAHPDHFAGAVWFEAPVYALPSVKELIDGSGAVRIERGYLYTPGHDGEEVVSPSIDRAVEPGDEEIDGVVFRFYAVADAETTEQLAVGLPDQGVLIAPDVLYNGVHMFIGEHAFDAWEAAIDELEAMPYESIIPGHGLPGGREIYASSRSYLEAARGAFAAASSPEDLNRWLEAAFPEYGGTAMQGLQNFYLFPRPD
jgi:glyoxylase-like metal-dependent hydrolase (beta-lactamase superfamily II)